jgi:hypothetical protein
LIWYVTKGTDGPNRFGPDPLTTLVIPPAPRAAGRRRRDQAIQHRASHLDKTLL